MRPKKSEYDLKTIKAFKQNNVLSIIELESLLQLSTSTIRRRLKEWCALSSYNYSGRYYTLPSIPEFNKKGLWKYKGIYFSKRGTLKNTIIHLIQISNKGLSNFEIEEILGINPSTLRKRMTKLNIPFG